MRRDTSNRMVAGVCSGIANSTGASVGIIRGAFFALACVGTLGLWLYVGLWIFTPKAKGAKQ